jgi:Fur family ferric uptake transcriptional regulator
MSGRSAWEAGSSAWEAGRAQIPEPGTAGRLLRSAGLRVTEVRLATLECLLRAGEPLSHGELAGLPALQALDRVTLYRTLHALRAARLVHAVQGIDGSWRYCAHLPEGGGCPGDHPHFLCERCGRMWCLPGQRLPQIDVPEGHAVRGKQLLAYGLCEECRGP